MDNIVIVVIFGFIALVILINMFKFIANFFSNRKRYNEIYKVRGEVNSKIRPHLHSLEQKFKSDANAGNNFGHYVFELFKDKMATKNEKMLEKAICKCCDGYDNAECKEDYCLEGSGASCAKK